MSRLLTHPIVRCIFAAVAAVVYVGDVAADDHWLLPSHPKSVVGCVVYVVLFVVEIVVVYSVVLLVYSFVCCVVVVENVVYSGVLLVYSFVVWSVVVVFSEAEVCQKLPAASCSVES